MAACSSPEIFWSAMKPPRPVSSRGSSTRFMLRPIHLRLTWPAGAASTAAGVMYVVIGSRSRGRVGGAAGADTRGEGGGGGAAPGAGVRCVVIGSGPRVGVGGPAGADPRGDGGGGAAVELAGGALH